MPVFYNVEQLPHFCLLPSAFVLRILLVINMPFQHTQGGVQQSTYKLARIFAARGHQVRLLSFAEESRQEVEDLKVTYCGQALKSSEALSRIFLAFNPEICINQAGYELQLTRLLRKVGGENMTLIATLRINPLNFVQNIEGFINDFLLKKGLSFLPAGPLKGPVLRYHRIRQYLFYKKTLAVVDGLVLLSQGFIEEIRYFYPSADKHRSKLFGIPNPFPLINTEQKVKKEKVILFVGRLNFVQKRVDLLLEIWKQLHGLLPDWSFWVVGDGPEKKWMEKQCKIFGMNRVKFFGYDDPTRYYQKASILHFTSAYEGFGNVLVEAQSHGVAPVLFDSYSAASDIISDGENGLLVTPFDVATYVHRTLQIAADPDDLRRLANNAQLNAGRYDFESIARQWEKLFKELRR